MDHLENNDPGKENSKHKSSKARVWLEYSE